jgi:hypothetical protein
MGNELADFIKNVALLEKLSHCQLLRKNSAALSYSPGI